MEGREESRGRNLRAFAVLLIGAAAVLMVCSMSSWLYPVNPWADVNILSTVGRGMFDGMVPYRDLFDHKGPLIYLLFGLCMALGGGTYHGLYVLEVLCCAGALFFGWKTIRMYLPRVSPLWMIAFFAILASCPIFSTGGSVEELLWFPAAWSLRDLLASWRRGRPLSAGALVRNGVLAGCVLWTKFNLLGFYFVWMAAVAIESLAREKRLWPAVRMCLAFLAGMALMTLPWLIYFGRNGAIGDFLRGYLTDNLFLYGTGEEGPLVNIARWIVRLARDYPVYMALLALSGLSVLLIPRGRMAVREKVLLVALAGVVAASMFSRRYYLIYYAVFLAIFLPFALLPLCAIRADRRVRWPRWAAPIASVAVIVAATGFACANSGNTRHIGTPYSETPQAQIAQAIWESGVEAPTLLQYRSMDTGFYLAADARPADRWFTATNIHQEEYLSEVDRRIAEGVPDFLVASLLAPGEEPAFERYERVCGISTNYGFGEGETARFILYQRIEEG